VSPATENARATVAATLFTAKLLMRSRFSLIAAVLQPIVYASITGFMLEAGARERLTTGTMLGAAVMGSWTSVLFLAGGTLNWERRQGTLPFLVAAPVPLLAVAAGSCTAAALLSLYSMAGSLALGALVFDVPLELAHPALFVLATLVMIVSMSLLGLLLCGAFVLYRQAGMFTNMLEYPVWIVCGLLVPVSTLSPGFAALGALLAPRWALDALRGAAMGGSSVWPGTAACCGLGAAYAIGGAFLLRYAERRARVTATLHLR
jgi:ABC-2 type transport system permease protein